MMGFCRWKLLHVLATYVAGALVYIGLQTSAYAEAPSIEPVQKTVRFGLTVRNPLDRPLAGEKLFVYGPATTSNQQIVRLDATKPYKLSSDELGNNLMVFELPDLAPYATLRISISATLSMSASPPNAPTPQAAAYLAAEPYVEADHPEIRRRSAILAEGVDDPTFVRRVYDWSMGHVRYAGFVADDQGALYALNNRSGDCSEYAYLVAALNRAKRVPTRVLGGFVVPSNAVLRSADYHNWNEVYLGGRWQVVDAQKGIFMDRTSDYVVTRIVSRQGGGASEGFFHRYLTSGGVLRVDMD